MRCSIRNTVCILIAVNPFILGASVEGIARSAEANPAPVVIGGATDMARAEMSPQMPDFNRWINDLQALTCHELMNRHFEKGERRYNADTVELDTLVSDGLEFSLAVKRGKSTYDAISKVPGPWHSGELSMMLKLTSEALAAGPYTVRSATKSSGEPAWIWSFSVLDRDSQWTYVKGTSITRLAFTGQAWVSKITGNLLEIRWQSEQSPAAVASGLREIVWVEDFSVASVSGVETLIPHRSSFDVMLSDMQHQVVETTFVSYRRYSADVVVRFDSFDDQ